ncbi:MAG: hypothetical protein MJA27_29065 [Pseudanabaenales cyanobacterium]|nr:hypothetical protein [Pseudanabaenales cyanobacterium]
MTINRISAALEQADRDAVMAAISTIREKAAVNWTIAVRRLTIEAQSL